MKRCQYCVNQNSPDQFLYLRAIQGHSGDNAVDLALQDNVLLPRGFTECRERERSEFHDKKWIDSRRKEPQKRKTSTTVNPMEDVFGVGETPRDFDETKVRTSST